QQDGVAAENLIIRRSMSDPFIPFIQETLKKYPKLTATRLHEMVKARGYLGSASRFREIVAKHRPYQAEAFMRVRTLPGEQAQVDWAHFGKIKIGKAERRLLGFVMVLSWSRAIFLQFYLGDATPNFLRGHVDAFDCWKHVPRKILYDNLKSAVLERNGDAIRFNETLLELAKHYRFEPVPVNVARGNEKGRVERAISFIRTSFFAAREYANLDDLNKQALDWCQGLAADRRCAEDRSMTVAQAFELEKPSLLSLPDNPFPVYERDSVRVGKTPYIRFDLNDYSVPHSLVRKTLQVVADLEKVRVMDGLREVACHKRSLDKGDQIEDPQHIEALKERKLEAKKDRGMDRLHHAAPTTGKILELAAQRGQNLGALTTGLLHLLDLYGAVELEQAVTEAVGAQACHVAAVRQVLERRRSEQDLPGPVAISLPADPRIQNLVVVPHDLASYDTLHAMTEETNHE
ncbi:MAG: IS21 family transposase, partial [Nitrososphaerales archaeon]